MTALWIDTDIALGARRGDVDDGWALAVALRGLQQGKVRIAGISACAGNTDAETAFNCASALVAAMDVRDVPVIRAVDAPREIAKLSADVHIAALGPLTNIANALRIDPALATRTSVSWIGTVINPWLIRRRLSDLNMKRDRNAVRLVSAAFSKPHTFPLDVVERMTLDRARMQRIATSSALGEYLATHSDRWMKRALWSHGRYAFPLWDLVSMLHSIDALPGAKFDDANRLIDFDVEGAWGNVEELLRG
jgi:inosine-uridine nucleoside N-ribohydrolase